MNFESLKIEFKKYLKQRAKSRKTKYKLDDSQKSIFSYSKEFKSYLENKLDIDISDLTKSSKDLSQFKLVDGLLVDKESKDKDIELSDFDDVELDDSEILIAILNDLLQDDDFKDIIDRNSDGKIDKEEMDSFYDSIKENDEDKKSVSLEDIIGALDEISSGKFKFADEIENEKLQHELLSNSSSGGGSHNSISNSSSPVKNNDSKGDVTKMSQDELEQELTNKESELGSAQDELVQNQNALTSIEDGSDSELQKAQENIDTAYEEYQNGLKEADKELAKKIDDKKIEIDDKKKIISQNDAAISQQQTIIQICEMSAQAAESELQGLNASLSSLKETQNSADENQKSDISSQISEIEQQITQVRQEADEAKQQLEEAQKESDRLNDENKTAKEELSALESEMSELESQTAQKYPQIEEQMELYKEAQENYDTLKETKIQSANSDIEASLENVANINNEVTQIQNLINEKKYSVNTSGEKAAEYAKNFIGYSESDGSADIFTKERNTTSSATPWCAAFVNYVLKNSGAWDKVASWYKNCQNTWQSSTIYQSAKENNAIINASEAKAGDVVVFNRGGKISHTGLVYSVSDDGTLYTIEGNTGNGVVDSHSYSVNDKQLIVCKATV